MSFTHDTLGRMVSYTDKLNKTKTWTVDEAGRELSMTNRNTETLTRTYDAAGRLATVTGPGIDRELRYDPLGRLVFAREGQHITETRYDEAGPTSVHVYSSNATLGHIDATWAVGHDAAGRLQTLVGPRARHPSGRPDRSRWGGDYQREDPCRSSNGDGHVSGPGLAWSHRLRNKCGLLS